MITTETTTKLSTSADATTSTPCPPGHVLTPSESCVNTNTDVRNCGSIGYECPGKDPSCSAGICRFTPVVQLTDRVVIPSWNGSTTIDDHMCPIHLPFNITLYNYSTSNVILSNNGVVCLANCSAAHTNGPLPAANFNGPTAFAYWDDLEISAETTQSVHYGIDGRAPNRTLTLEFYESHHVFPNQLYRFQVVFYENAPGIVKYIYLEATDTGASATIGVQKSADGSAIRYSFDQRDAVTPNKTITFDTNLGNYTD